MADVLMPQMGESIVEGTVTKWLKQVGEGIERDEPLLEISTDKVDAEVPAPITGVLTEILVQEGETVEINTVVGRIGEDASASKQSTAQAVADSGPAPDESGNDNIAAAEAPPLEAPRVTEPPPEDSSPIRSSPLVKRLAREHNIDLRQIRGTAQGGRISKKDIEAYLKTREDATADPLADASLAATETSSAEEKTSASAGVPEPEKPQVTEDPSRSSSSIRSSPLVLQLAKEHHIDLREIKGTGQGGRISRKDIEAYLTAREQIAASNAQVADVRATGGADLATVFPAAPEARFGEHRVKPLGRIRKIIAEHMVMTMRVAPHVSTIHRVDVTEVAKEREKAKHLFQERNGVRLTYIPFFLRAAASALKAFPLVNASLDGDQIIYHDNVNIGVAVAIEGGVIVPVIKRADEKSILGLQKAVADLAVRARSKQLKPQEVREGTFTISNFGTWGSFIGVPAINQPQAAILALGAVHKEPVVVNDAIAIRSVAHVTLTFDHRLFDGATAERFMNHLKGIIENWSESAL